MALITNVNVHFYSWTISREITKITEHLKFFFFFFLLISFLERIKNILISNYSPYFLVISNFWGLKFNAARGSSIGSMFTWHASGPKFDLYVQHILSWSLGHENISTAILHLPLIQEEQLSVTGERICTKSGKLPRRLAQEQCG